MNKVFKSISLAMSLVLMLTALISSAPAKVYAANAISSIDTSRSTHDRVVMNVDGEPFFYNGIQIRPDSLKRKLNYTDDQIKAVYQLAADDGFTVVNSQLYWSDIQPDQFYDAVESTYISGGSNRITNYSSSSSMKTKYDADDASNQALAYFKFDFSSISGSSCDASKIRIFVNDIDSGTCNLHLYGITDDSWDASTITWANGAPNHSYYDITGTEGVDYYDLGVTPSYDPVN